MHKFLKRQFRHRKSIFLQILCKHRHTHSLSSQPSPIPAFLDSLWTSPSLNDQKPILFRYISTPSSYYSLSLTRPPFFKLSDVKIILAFSFSLPKAWNSYFLNLLAQFPVPKMLVPLCVMSDLCVLFPSSLYSYLKQLLVFHITACQLLKS